MATIPETFRAVDPYLAKWAIRRHRDRVQARLAANIDELAELQQAVLPQMRAIIETLDSYSLDAIPAELEPYGCLVLTVAAYDLAVNRFGQVAVPFGSPLDKIVFLDDPPDMRWD